MRLINVDKLIAEFMNKALDYDSAIELIESMPTIEVSEDCISKHDIWKIIEDNAYWVRYNENSTEKGMTLTGINQALNECPPAILTVSEDCISRAELRKSLARPLENNNADEMYWKGWHDCTVAVETRIADAPSVVK